MIDREDIIRLTEEYGGRWGINHTRRLLHLISIIGQDQEYNADAVWLAAHLHDWGGYSPWVQKEVDHALRSKQVAEAFLAERGAADDLIVLALWRPRNCLHPSSRSRRMVSTSSGKITPAKATKSLAFCYHMQVKPTPTSTFAQTDT